MTELTADRVSQAVQAILDTLGEPNSNLHSQALKAFQNGDSATIKRLSVVNLSDNYLKCLGYLVSASKLTPNTDTILAESARSASEFVKDQTLAKLGIEIDKALN